jgi:hypothetical protein
MPTIGPRESKDVVPEGIILQPSEMRLRLDQFIDSIIAWLFEKMH